MFEWENYQTFAKSCEYILFWSLTFTTFTFIRLVQQSNAKEAVPAPTTIIAKKENLFLEELPGLAFICLHTMSFVYATTWSTRLIYLYWGPLYFVTAYLVVFKYKVEWKRIATISSITCKMFYVFYVAIFWSMKLWLPIYMYSLWIMHDQVRLAWFKNNADRTRRLFEDWWFPRIGYLLGLFMPFLVAVAANPIVNQVCCLYSIVIMVAYVGGMVRLWKLGIFFVQPKIEGFGRDIVYL